MWDKMVVTHESVELVPDIDKTIMENFRDAILKGEKRLTPGEKGINAVEFFNACIMSAKLDKPVNIPVPRKEYDELMEELKKTSKEKTGVKEQRVTDPKLQNLP